MGGTATPVAPAASPVARAPVAPAVVPATRVGGAPVSAAPVAAVAELEPARQGLLGNISLDQPLREARDEFERVYFEYHLQRENHSMTRVSEKTGLERTHLYRKLRQLGIDSSRKRNA